jgi:hypothetical protein
MTVICVNSERAQRADRKDEVRRVEERVSRIVLAHLVVSVEKIKDRSSKMKFYHHITLSIRNHPPSLKDHIVQEVSQIVENGLAEDQETIDLAFELAHRIDHCDLVYDLMRSGRISEENYKEKLTKTKVAPMINALTSGWFAHLNKNLRANDFWGGVVV